MLAARLHACDQLKLDCGPNCRSAKSRRLIGALTCREFLYRADPVSWFLVWSNFIRLWLDHSVNSSRTIRRFAMVKDSVPSIQPATAHVGTLNPACHSACEISAPSMCKGQVCGFLALRPRLFARSGKRKIFFVMYCCICMFFSAPGRLVGKRIQRTCQRQQLLEFTISITVQRRCVSLEPSHQSSQGPSSAPA